MNEDNILPPSELETFYLCVTTLAESIEAARKYNCEEAERLWDKAHGYVDSLSEESKGYTAQIAIAAVHYIEKKWHQISVGEFAYHNYFEKNIAKLLPGWKIAKHPRKRLDHIPDFFIEKDGAICPVEIKKSTINLSALRQIKRYMKVFKASKGFVAAQECIVDLPETITFVPLPAIESTRGTLMESIVSR
jgi:hypothetical protein